jgi:hypothetical protein
VRGDPIFSITVRVDVKRNATFSLYADDDMLEVVSRFAADHRLTSEMKSLLLELLENELTKHDIGRQLLEGSLLTDPM